MKILKILTVILCVFMMLAFNFSFVLAATESELQQQKKDIDAKIEETTSEINAKKSEMSTALNQINDLNSQISNYESEIDNLESAIGTLNTQISGKETSIQEQEAKYAEQKDLLDKRLVALYESGSTSYLEMLLTVDSLSDFISKYYIISEIAEYDNELLTNIQNTKDAIQNEKTQLEEYKTAVESNKTELTTKKTSLNNSVNQKTTLVANLSDEEKELEDQLEEFEKDKKEVAAQIAALAKKSSVKAGAPSAAGYICPIAGKTKANITTGYYGYSGHTGVDFACSSGTPILAAKSGTVVVSTALRSSSGAYRSYGEYIIIDHNDGTMTLYAHMSQRLVSKGQSVSQGQQIGCVGSTGNSTGPHLHFEVFANGSRTNPTPYLP